MAILSHLPIWYAYVASVGVFEVYGPAADLLHFPVSSRDHFKFHIQSPFSEVRQVSRQIGKFVPSRCNVMSIDEDQISWVGIGV